MKPPRFRIAWLMAIVALAALNLAAIRAASDSSSGPEVLLCMVALPMTNVLALAILIGHRHRGWRRLLLGFEAFGVSALAYLIVAILSGEAWVWSYITLVLEPTRAIVRPSGGANWSTIRLLVGRSILSAWATLPQLAFALVGGFLFHWLGTVDRRGHSGG
jgi:hypothetical protein